MKKPVADFINCINSLNNSCAEAGGNAPDLSALDSMSALELIDHISSNAIRFEYIGDVEEAVSHEKD